MKQQRHIIKRQVLELRIDDPAQAAKLHKDLSRIYRQRIVPLIDRYCSRFSNPDTIDRIESLQLDVGPIDAERLEQDLVRQVEQQLRKYLPERANNRAKTNQTSDTARKTASQLELFNFYARSGALPWWTDSNRDDALKACLDYLLQQAPEHLNRLLRQLLRQDRPLRRLVHTYTDQHLAAMLSGLVTISDIDSDQCLADVPLRLLNALSASKSLVNCKPTRLRPAMWFGLLREAGLNGKPNREASEFFVQVLVRVANELGVTYRELQADLAFPLIEKATKRSSVSDIQQINNALAALKCGPFQEEALAKLLELLPVAIRSADFPKPLLQRVLTVLRQVKATSIPLAQLNTLGHQLESVLQGPDTLHAPDESAVLDMSFSESDQIDVGNAGLVILWPFLESFFERLGLLHAKRFKEGVARQRACALLQFLVNEDPSPPEFMLPLNKILCSMEVDAVFERGDPVTSGEAEECRLLLEAVIEHATILKNMSVPGFRNTFLRRRGSLSSRDGAWLLRVERETHDILLEHFPWNIEWVKLPWMILPLRVEW